MTSEELELSLKTDFENYFKETLAAVRQDVNDFQRSYESEFAKHKSQMDDALRVLSERIESGPALDKGFTETVIEHLRLARDEGARLTATAFSEAEKLQSDIAPEARYDLLKTAVDDISSRKSQADILGALIEHSSNFAPRGVFFIVKSEQFAAWRSFGDSDSADQERSVSMPVASDTILAAAINGPSTSEGSYGNFADDEQFLGPLELGRPDRMYAIPLTARGRGVAVLYVDYGIDGLNVNVAALETLVRVAGLTVELRAAAQSAAAAPAPAYTPPVQSAAEEPEIEVAEVEEVEEPSESAEHETPAEVADPGVSESAAEVELAEIVYEEAEIHSEPMVAEAVQDFSEQIEYQAVEEIAEVQPVDDADQPDAGFEYSADAEVVAEQTENYSDSAFQQQDNSAIEVQTEVSYDAAEPVGETNGHSADDVPRRRFGSRDIDLPIEVTDDERKYHTNARRFARLLVSEIKLYNEQRVTEGRESGDLYDRLREAIDRSREMYDKRVEPQVAAKFDYFHYEILNDLADGDAAKLGNTYPGAVV